MLCLDFCDYSQTGDVNFEEKKNCACFHANTPHCKLTEKCTSNCTDSCGFNIEEGGDFYHCSETNSCIPITAKCNGNCLNPFYMEMKNRRHWCDEEQACKGTFETCSGKCVKPMPLYNRRKSFYYCKETGLCVNYKEQCNDGCPVDQLYCAETGKCRSRYEPCYKECVVKFKGKTAQRHNYCEESKSCVPFFRPCNGTCLSYPRENSHFGLEPEVNMTMCPHPEANICFEKKEYPNAPFGPAVRAITKAEEMCDMARLGCAKDEIVCQGKCQSLSKKCFFKNLTFKCTKKFAGVFHNYRWCEHTQTCIGPEVPCKGKCLEKKPRMAYCKANNSCINIKDLCGDECLLGRWKCKSKDRCIHKSAVENGVKDCEDGSDENLQ